MLQRKTFFLICLLLIGLILIVYGQTYDDATVLPDEVAAIKAYREGLTLSNFKKAFLQSSYMTAYWAPVSFITCMIDAELFSSNAGPRHLVNVSLHTCSTLFLFMLFYRTTRKTWPSALVAGLFAIHPLNVEPVACIGVHETPLSVFFAILCMIAYTDYVRELNKKKYCLSLFFFLLGLMSKPTIILLPLLLLILDYWPLDRLFSDTEDRRYFLWYCLKEKIPFFLISGVWITGSFYFYTQSDFYALAISRQLDLSAAKLLLNIPVAYLTYIIKIFLPTALATDRFLPRCEVTLWQTLLAVFILVITTGVVWMKTKRGDRFLGAGWLWFLVATAPGVLMSATKQQLITGRYSYLGVIGIFIIIGWSILERIPVVPYKKAAVDALLTTVISILTCLAWQNTTHWQNRVALLKHVITIVPNNRNAYWNLGDALLASGEENEAIKFYRHALMIGPESEDIYNNMGVAFLNQDDNEKAIQCFQKVLQLSPGHAKAHNNIGNALLNINKYNEAIVHFKAALKIDPLLFQTHNSLAAALIYSNRHQEAVYHLEKALEINPGYTTARDNLIKITRMQNHLPATTGSAENP